MSDNIGVLKTKYHFGFFKFLLVAGVGVLGDGVSAPFLWESVPWLKEALSLFKSHSQFLNDSTS